jgi:hypothetical protein
MNSRAPLESLYCQYFEIEEGERNTRCGLYEQLIALSRHVKLWISYVLFEAELIPVPRAERERERRKVKMMMLSPRPFPVMPTLRDRDIRI